MRRNPRRGFPTISVAATIFYPGICHGLGVKCREPFLFLQSLIPVFMNLRSNAISVAALLAALIARTGAEEIADANLVMRIFDERCVECHAPDENEGGLVLENYEGVLKGGESGAAIVPGTSAESLLVKYLRGEVEKDGKKKFMPPGKREKLSAQEIQLISRWIDAGATRPAAIAKREIKVPRVEPKVAPRHAINALAAHGPLIAVGRYGVVELIKADTREVVRRLEGHRGNVNALVFSADGATLFSGSGENAITGEIRQWSVADGKLTRALEGHRDTIYALALAPDGKTLASGSYDQQIKLWDVNRATELRTLRGHNGAVFSVAFRPDGKLLASASADRTLKLWDVATGQRRDTLSQPTKEQVALAWSADGKRLAAGGYDNRIRVWEVSAEGKETTNPLAVARFAHESPISRLLWSPDGKTIASAAHDRQVKLWDATAVKERALLEIQPDWPSALAFAGETLVVGRLDGTIACYQIVDGRPIAATPPPKPNPAKVSGVLPRGIQRGREGELKLLGTNLAGLKSVAATDSRLQVRSADGANPNEARLWITTPAELPRGPYEIKVTGADGAAAGTVSVMIDDLPQHALGSDPVTFPAAIWGVLEKPGDRQSIAFNAKAGETLVFDLAAKSIGSKADAVLSLVDSNGQVLARSNDFDATGDPFIAHTFRTDGRYSAVVVDLQLAGSSEHFFRLTAGAFPFVTACLPLSVPPNAETEVELIGYHLPTDRKVKVKSGTESEISLPLDREKFRARRDFKLLVSALPSGHETEPNDSPAQANVMPAPVGVHGRIGAAKDADLVRFDAKIGSVWAIETQAAQRGSPLDTKIEVLDAAGRKVERLLLQAVRDSAITFRPIDSGAADARVDNWREMELNQFMFLNGEVARIFRMPEGPDSGFQFYANGGKRIAYFNTTATAHALDEPCYIVEPRPPGTKLIANGLPVFTLFYENDDDGDRQIGTDSRLLFTAPADGAYFVRVSDSRGLGSDRHVYRLVIREAAPDFNVAVGPTTISVNAGSGQAFNVSADRKDGFDEDISVEISGVPDGYKITTPMVIQAGHSTARGTFNALAGAKPVAPEQSAKVKITATAQISGQPRVREVGGFAKVTLAKEPSLFVALEPVAPGDTLEKLSPPTPFQDQDPARPSEITIAPGEIIPAWIKVKRKDHQTEIRFDVENLPHGVIVDNLGLNGITLLTGQNEGEIHLKAEPWVPETSRLIFAQTREAGKQTSLPVILHVRHKPGAKLPTLSIK